VGGPAIKQIPQLPVWVWFVMTMGIAFAEALRIQKGWANPYDGEENIQRLKPGYMPGDLGWDPLGLKPTDPKAFKRCVPSSSNFAFSPASFRHDARPAHALTVTVLHSARLRESPG
jgi:hypothetical protein